MRLALLQKVHCPHSGNLDAELAAVGGTRPARYMCHTLISNLISIQRTIFSTLISMQHTLLAFQSRSRGMRRAQEQCVGGMRRVQEQFGSTRSSPVEELPPAATD